MFHIVWYSPPTSETTIGVVGCNLVWRDVNDKVDVKMERELIHSHWLIQVLLEAAEYLANLLRLAKFGHGVGDGVVVFKE